MKILRTMLSLILYAVYMESFFIARNMKKNFSNMRDKSLLPLAMGSFDFPDLPRNLSVLSITNYFHSLYPEIIPAHQPVKSRDYLSLASESDLQKIEPSSLHRATNDNKKLIEIAESFQKRDTALYYSKVLRDNPFSHPESTPLSSKEIIANRAFLKKDFQLINAVKTRSLKLVKLYCEDDSHDFLGWIDVDGNSALHIALREDLQEIFQYLIVQADLQTITAVNSHGQNILHLAIHHSPEAIFHVHQIFISRYNSSKQFDNMCEQKDNQEYSPFALACYHGYVNIAQCFINYLGSGISKQLMQDAKDLAEHACCQSFANKNEISPEATVDYEKTIKLLDSYLNPTNHTEKKRSFGKKKPYTIYYKKK